jgi:ectoine hydroxylase-related dioxygenase (phytanoyl-CoA dioxygenase family)
MPHLRRTSPLLGTARRARARAGRAARRLVRNPRLPGAIRRQADRAVDQARSDRPALQVLSHQQALKENGFTIFRGLYSPAEVAQLAAGLKRDAGITEGEHFTRVDATNRVPSTRQVLFDEKLLTAVRSSLSTECRFLQAGDLHYLHDTAGWHRDSVHRAEDNSASADWSDRDGPYGVVKAIVYLESDNAAMGLIAGSHLSPIAFDRDLVIRIEKIGGQLVIDAADEPNRRFSAAEKRVPMAWKAFPGDVLVFDERTYHAGRRVDDGRVTKNREAAKFCLSLTFGSDNMHSYRYYSYFRYARKELGFVKLTPDYVQALREHDLLLSSGLGNYYLKHPQEVRLVHLRHPEMMDELVEQFTRAGSGRPRPAGGTSAERT